MRARDVASIMLGSSSRGLVTASRKHFCRIYYVSAIASEAPQHNLDTRRIARDPKKKQKIALWNINTDEWEKGTLYLVSHTATKREALTWLSILFQTSLTVYVDKCW